MGDTPARKKGGRICHRTELGSCCPLHSKAKLLKSGCGEGKSVFIAGDPARSVGSSNSKDLNSPRVVREVFSG